MQVGRQNVERARRKKYAELKVEKKHPKCSSRYEGNEHVSGEDREEDNIRDGRKPVRT